MEPLTFQQQFDKAIKDYAQGNQYGVSAIPYHTHNGTDSPKVAPMGWDNSQSQTLGSDTASVTFSTINTNYKMLRLSILGGVSASANIIAVFNGDTTASYHYNISVMQANAFLLSSVASIALSNDTRLGRMEQASGCFLQATFGNIQSVNKSFIAQNNVLGGTTTTAVVSGEWRNTTSQITSIKLSLTAGNWKAGTLFILEGFLVQLWV